MAELIRGLSDNGGVVFCGVDSTDIVCKAEELHTTSATCSAALGRLLTGAALIGSWMDDAANGGRSALKSIKQNDTEFQFAVAETASAGSTMDADLEALHPKLNLYRKVRWPTCPCHTSDAAQP